MFKQISKYANWNLTIFPFLFDNIFFDNIILSLQISWFIFTKSCFPCFWRRPAAMMAMIALSRVQAEQGNSEEFQYKWCRFDLIPRKEALMPAHWLHTQRVDMDAMYNEQCRSVLHNKVTPRIQTSFSTPFDFSRSTFSIDFSLQIRMLYTTDIDYVS